MNPRKFDYAKPLKRWREGWPESYHRMLKILREKWPEGRGVQEFIRILHIHQDYPAALVQEAVEQALTFGCVHQLAVSESSSVSLDLSDRPDLDVYGNQPVDLSRYEQLLKQSW